MSGIRDNTTPTVTVLEKVDQTKVALSELQKQVMQHKQEIDDEADLVVELKNFTEQLAMVGFAEKEAGDMKARLAGMLGTVEDENLELQQLSEVVKNNLAQMDLEYGVVLEQATWSLEEELPKQLAVLRKDHVRMEKEKKANDEKVRKLEKEVKGQLNLQKSMTKLKAKQPSLKCHKDKVTGAPTPGTPTLEVIDKELRIARRNLQQITDKIADNEARQDRIVAENRELAKRERFCMRTLKRIRADCENASRGLSELRQQHNDRMQELADIGDRQKQLRDDYERQQQKQFASDDYETRQELHRRRLYEEMLQNESHQFHGEIGQQQRQHQAQNPQLFLNQVPDIMGDPNGSNDFNESNGLSVGGRSLAGGSSTSPIPSLDERARRIYEQEQALRNYEAALDQDLLPQERQDLEGANKRLHDFGTSNSSRSGHNSYSGRSSHDPSQQSGRGRHGSGNQRRNRQSDNNFLHGDNSNNFLQKSSEKRDNSLRIESLRNDTISDIPESEVGRVSSRAPMSCEFLSFAIFFTLVFTLLVAWCYRNGYRTKNCKQRLKIEEKQGIVNQSIAKRVVEKETEGGKNESEKRDDSDAAVSFHEDDIDEV